MKPAPVTGEHDFEPVEGLPERPPEGERLLWQGRPSWWGLALRVFHVRKIAIYFAILAAWHTATGIYDGYGWAATLEGLAIWGSVALTGLALLMLFAWLYAKTTMYTITSRRLVMRFGLALTLTVNLPFRLARQAHLRVCSDGTGDIPVEFDGEHRVGYVHMWPFVRPWCLRRPQPMLRAVRNPEKVSEILISAIHGTPVAAAVETEEAEADSRGGAMPAPAE